MNKTVITVLIVLVGVVSAFIAYNMFSGEEAAVNENGETEMVMEGIQSGTSLDEPIVENEEVELEDIDTDALINSINSLNSEQPDTDIDSLISDVEGIE